VVRRGNRVCAHLVAIKSLPSRGRQAASGGFLLDEKLALPEKIEIAALFIGQVHAMLEACDAPPGDAEQFEKLVVKSLRLAVLVLGANPRRISPRGP
jgi:hypothetical protein